MLLLPKKNARVVNEMNSPPKKCCGFCHKGTWYMYSPWGWWCSSPPDYICYMEPTTFRLVVNCDSQSFQPPSIFLPLLASTKRQGDLEVDKNHQRILLIRPSSRRRRSFNLHDDDDIIVMWCKVVGWWHTNHHHPVELSWDERADAALLLFMFYNIICW